MAVAQRQDFVQAMRRFPAAVNLICCGRGETRAGFTASAVMSLTADPAQLAVAVGREVSAFAQLTGGTGFTVNTLAGDQIDLAGNFAGRLKGAARFSGGSWTDTPCGPRLEGALLGFECEIADRVELSSHVLLIARVLRVTRNPAQRPLLYVEGDWAGLMPLGKVEAGGFLDPVRDSIAAIEAARAEAADPAGRLARFIERFTAVYIGRQDESRDYFSVELYVREAHLAEINAAKRDFDARLARLLEEGRAAGVFAFDDTRLTVLALTGMIGWTHRWYRPEGRMSRAEVGRHFARLALRMLGADPAALPEVPADPAPETAGAATRGGETT